MPVSVNESIPGDVGDVGLAEPHEIRWMEGNLESASAGAHMNDGQREGALVDHSGQPSSLAERTYPANDVAGGACSVGGGGKCNASGAERVGGGLEVERTVDGHEGDGQTTAIGGHDERLEHRPGRQPERLGGFQAEGGGGVVMGIAENLERDAGTFGGADGGSDGLGRSGGRGDGNGWPTVASLAGAAKPPPGRCRRRVDCSGSILHEFPGCVRMKASDFRVDAPSRGTDKFRTSVSGAWHLRAGPCLVSAPVAIEVAALAESIYHRRHLPGRCT